MRPEIPRFAVEVGLLSVLEIAQVIAQRLRQLKRKWLVACADEGDDPSAAAHRKNARPSTKSKHEEGDARRDRDRAGERGDAGRRLPRKPPPDWGNGPWPPPIEGRWIKKGQR